MDPKTTQAVVEGSGDMMQALAAYFGGAEGRKQQKWNFGQRKDLYDLLRWHTYGKQKDVIDPKKMSMMQGQFRQSMQPAFADMLFNASRGGGMNSRQTSRMYARQRMPLEGGYLANLQKMNIGMTQNRDDNLLRLMASLTGGK